MKPDLSKTTGISNGYRMDATEDATTIYTEDGAHKFSFDPRVPMSVVHVVAKAHKAGMEAREPSIHAEPSAFVSGNGEGERVVLFVPPERLSQGQFVILSVDDARVLIAQLSRAANSAQRNAEIKGLVP